MSVVIPTYNRSSLVTEAIESCLRQDYENIEIIVVDDGSTDSTLAVLADFATRVGDRFRYLQQCNSGPAAARNAGLEIARGKYIKFLDSDDTIDDDAIRHYVDALEEAEADLCIGARRYMSPEGKKWQVNYRPEAGAICNALGKFFDLSIRPQQGLWCFRASLFRDGLRWDRDLLAREDTDLIARLLTQGASVVGAPEAVMNQRYHSGARQTGRQFEPEVFRTIHDSNRKLFELMVEHGRLEGAGRSFARSMTRTAVRAWVHDREGAKRCYRLAKQAYWWPELVLLPHYSRWTRRAAYLLWCVGGLRLCGPLMTFYCWRLERRQK